MENANRPVGVLAVSSPREDERQPLAMELAHAFGRTAELYRQEYSLSPEEARRKAAEVPEAHLQRIVDGPPDQVQWGDLDLIAQGDAELALKRWEQIKEAARQEVRSGHRAASALEDHGSCWERARFLTVRAELMATVQPRSAVEQQLVDQLAQWQTLLWSWQGVMANHTGLANASRDRIRRNKPGLELPRVSAAEAVEQAARMVERFHRLYLRTLRALQDQRRAAPILIHHARQVNVAQQQINLPE